MNKKDPTYSEEQIQEKLKAFPGWWYEDGWIRRNYKTDGWPTTLMLVTAIGYLAEAAYHHPDLAVTWGRVIVKLKNHAAGGSPKGLRASAQDRRDRAVAPQGRRAGRDAQQVRAVGRSAVTGRAREPRRALFVTGKLAEPALRRTLGEMAPAFAWDVAVMKITVAALMTTPCIARFLEVPAGTDLVLIPGLCEGDPALIAEQTGVTVEKGPKDVRQIPEY